MSVPNVHICLVDETGKFKDVLPQWAAALNEQIASDVAPAWPGIGHVSVGVGRVSPAQWGVHIVGKLDEPGALGYHANDSHNQPIAYVQAQTPDETSQTVSHETIEMVGDPFGNHMHSGRLPFGAEQYHSTFDVPSAHHYVHYLRELCDPPEANSYRVGGVTMSDFVLPAWYRSNAPEQVRFTQTGAAWNSRQVEDGGYVSFANDDGEWYQVFNEGGSLSFQDLGKFDKVKFVNLREFTDHHARLARSGDPDHGLAPVRNGGRARKKARH